MEYIKEITKKIVSEYKIFNGLFVNIYRILNI